MNEAKVKITCSAIEPYLSAISLGCDKITADPSYHLEIRSENGVQRLESLLVGLTAISHTCPI